MSNCIQLSPVPTELQCLPMSKSIQMYPSVSECIRMYPLYSLYPVRGTNKAGVTLPSALKIKVTNQSLVGRNGMSRKVVNLTTPHSSLSKGLKCSWWWGLYIFQIEWFNLKSNSTWQPLSSSDVFNLKSNSTWQPLSSSDVFNLKSNSTWQPLSSSNSRVCKVLLLTDVANSSKFFFWGCCLFGGQISLHWLPQFLGGLYTLWAKMENKSFAPESKRYHVSKFEQGLASLDN